MYYVNKISLAEPIDFAASELKKYLRMMMPEGGDVKITYAPDAKEGAFLLEEVWQAGNFGHHDERFDRTHYNRLSSRLWESMKRKARYLTHYPQEILFDLPFRVWLYLWRLGVERKGN